MLGLRCFVFWVCFAFAGPALGAQTTLLDVAHLRGVAQERRFEEVREATRSWLSDRAASEHGVSQAALLEADAIDLLVRAEIELDNAGAADLGSLSARAVGLRETVQGPDHADLAKTLRLRGEVLGHGAGLDEAVAVLERSIGILAGTPEKRSPAMAEALHVLGLTLQDRREYARADSVHRRSLVIFEEALGPDHLWTGRSLHASGYVLRRLSRFEEAQEAVERATAILEARLGPDHREVGNAWNTLGMIGNSRSDPDLSREAFFRALRIRERAYGPEHEVVAQSLNNLGIVHTQIGEYRDAAQFYERALAIKRATLGERHPSVAASYSNLALLFAQMRDLPAATAMQRHALAIKEAALGTDHPEIARSLNHLANLLSARGRFDEALPFVERALAIREKAFGPDSHEAGMSREILGAVQAGLQDLVNAEATLRRVREVRRRVLGSEHADVGSSEQALGRVLLRTGRAKEAHECFGASLTIWENVVGPSHPILGGMLRDLARAQLELDRPHEAIAFASRAEAIRRDHVRAATAAFTEERALAAAADQEPGLPETIAAALRFPDPALRATALDEVVRSRGLVLDAMIERRLENARSADPEIGDLWEALTRARTDHANLVVRGPRGGGQDEHRRTVEEAAEARRRAEEALARRSADFARRTVEVRGALDDVRASLDPGSVLVSFVRYPSWRPDGTVDRYVAFVTVAQREEVALVPLGDAGEIDALVAEWRTELFEGTATAPKRDAAVDPASGPGCRLREIIWDPVGKKASGTALALVVPDGALQFVSFAALPLGDGKYLVEEGPTFHYLSAERDVFRRGDGGTGAGLLAFGGPDFDARGVAPAAGGRATVPPAVYRGERPDCGDLASHRFSPLPASGHECERVTSLWSEYRGGEAAVEMLTGAAASEEAFKALAPFSGALHVASHGFFLAGGCVRLEGARGIGGLADLPPQPGQDNQEEDEPGGADVLRSPLLLSGLALAGANRREDAGAGQEDGILTAEEIAALDLSGVTSVVLSGCGTGLGVVRDGEGVLGLRRAFRVAGARTLVMSLWPIGDRSAAEWMEAFYEARLADGQDTAHAVRTASERVLRRWRAAGESTNPFRWGAFVSVGEWRGG